MWTRAWLERILFLPDECWAGVWAHSDLPSAAPVPRLSSDFSDRGERAWRRSDRPNRAPPHLRKNHRLPPPSASLIWVFFLPAYLDSCTQSQDAGIARVHGPPWGGKPQHGGPAQPTERQQPQHGHPQQVQSSRDGCSQPGTAVCSERAFLQWAEHEDGHEV